MTGPERPDEARPATSGAHAAAHDGGAPPPDHLVLYGSRILDLMPRGDLGPGLQAAEVSAFALVRGYARRGRFAVLPVPLVLAVPGEGRPPPRSDSDADAGERLWDIGADRPALMLELRHGSVGGLLGL